MKLMDIISVAFNAIHRLVIKYSAYIRHCRKNNGTVEQHISYLQTSRKSMIQLEEFVHYSHWIQYTHEPS
jgi:hypothetical protein